MFPHFSASWARKGAIETKLTFEPADYSDVGEAVVYKALNQVKHRYNKATGDIIFEGKRWIENELLARLLVQDLTDRQLHEVRGALKGIRKRLDAAVESGDEPTAKAVAEEEAGTKKYRSFVLDRRKTARITATLTEARPMLEIEVSELDADPFLINTPSGTVDLRTGAMRPHRAEDFITKITAVAPSINGISEWETFLHSLTCGDTELEETLQIILGMAIIGHVFEEKLIIAVGSGGNGKSTFFNVCARVLGDYSGALSAETLTANCRKNKSPELAELRGKRLIIAAELEEGQRLDTSIVKKLCSTDPVLAEKKYKDPLVFVPSHSVVLFTNHLPKVGSIDAGTWDRLLVIPFNARFRGVSGEVKNYADNLFEHCGGAILTWMIDGAKKFIEAGYRIETPACVKAAIEEYRRENDWLSAFLEDRCEVSPEYKQRAGELFEAYREYCASTFEWARSMSDFKAALVGAGFSWHKTASGAYYYGLKLK